jgi:hypothetical protein
MDLEKGETRVIPTARYFKGEPACEPATNPIRLNRTMCHSLGAHVRRNAKDATISNLHSKCSTSILQRPRSGRVCVVSL